MGTASKYLFYFLIILSNLTYSQVGVKSSLLTIPVLIELPNSKLSGSGFFFADSNSFFLVTAKHVLFDMKDNSLNDSIARLYNYPHNPERDQPNILMVSLLKLKNNNKYLISTQDICAFEIGTFTIAKDSNYQYINYSPYVDKLGPSTFVGLYGRNTFTLYESVRASTDLFIFGYPSSLSSERQFDPHRPLLRKGIISCKNDISKTIIIDCPSYPGNSGGPVVIQQISSGAIKYNIIGIVSQYIPFKDYWQSVSNKRIVHEQSYNSGLSVVIPMDALLDILPQYFAHQN
jgi:hypothetical protein